MKTNATPIQNFILAGLLILATQGQDVLGKEQVREEFHQAYALSSGGRVSADNVNGWIHIATWDREEIKVDAVKKANKPETLELVKIEIESKPDWIRIKTKYPESRSWWRKWQDNSASVEYTLTVPRSVRLDKVATVNGELLIDGVAGKVDASTVNGQLVAKSLSGDAALSTVNGRVEASFDALVEARSISLSTVNGRVEVTLPATADAEIAADTINGSISTDHPLTITKHWPLGRELRGTLGKGGARIKASTVNGSIHVRRSEPR